VKHKILCIDDDPVIQSLVHASLKGMLVTEAHSISEANLCLAKATFDAILVDIQLPDGDGLRFLNDFLAIEKNKSLPSFVFSSDSKISNKTMAFTLGADDFISKPFDPIELKLRIESKIKKTEAFKESQNIITIADLLIDFKQQKAFVVLANKNEDLNLTSIEFKLIYYLAAKKDFVFSRGQIMEKIWNNTIVSERTIDSHVSHLRKKLARTKVNIESLHNFGYKLKIESQLKDK